MCHILIHAHCISIEQLLAAAVAVCTASVNNMTELLLFTACLIVVYIHSLLVFSAVDDKIPLSLIHSSLRLDMPAMLDAQSVLSFLVVLGYMC